MLCTPHINRGLQIQLFRNASKKSLSESPLWEAHSNGGLEQASDSTLEGLTTRKCLWAGIETIETAMGYMKPMQWPIPRCLDECKLQLSMPSSTFLYFSQYQDQSMRLTRTVCKMSSTRFPWIHSESLTNVHTQLGEPNQFRNTTSVNLPTCDHH